MRKILFHLYNLERGGAERVVSTLSEHFALKGYQVVIATEEYGKDEYPISASIERIHAGLTEKQEKSNRLFKYFYRIFNLRKIIKKVSPDIVVAFAHKNNYRALAASAGLSIPVVISVRNNPEEFYSSLADKIQMKLLFGRASGCVFQTNEQKEFFSEELQKKSCVILNPINPKFIGGQLPENREKIVVHSGRLVDFKNQLLLIDAFIEVHEKHPDYQLKLFGGDTGDGTKVKLEKLIEENKAEEYIHIMGQSQHIEKDLTQGMLAAFSSDYEGMPNAMLEALALGLPVVATDCPPGGPRMVIDDQINGLLVPVKDKEALVQAMLYLIENPQTANAMGSKAAKKIAEICSVEAVFKQWETYLETICNFSN